MQYRNPPLAVLVATLFAALPGVASATTVTREGDSRDIRIDDTTGVVDRLEVAPEEERSITVTSLNGLPLVAETSGLCTQKSATVVSCPVEINSRLQVGLGGGDDSFLDREGLSGHFDGGPGNDTITAGGRDDTVRGGPGNDTLNGAAGNDVLLGQDGDDVENGGTGNDRLGARDRNVPSFDDPGADTLRGGLGNDDLFSFDGVPEKVIDCGQRGVDFARIDLVDPAPVDCTTVQEGAKDQHPTVQVRGRALKLRGRRVRVRLQCPSTAPGGRCDGKLAIVKSGRTLASGSYQISAGKSRTLRLRLRRRTAGRALIRTAELDTQGRPETTITAVRLRR
jgi:hypothetical protein